MGKNNKKTEYLLSPDALHVKELLKLDPISLKEYVEKRIRETFNRSLESKVR